MRKQREKVSVRARERVDELDSVLQKLYDFDESVQQLTGDINDCMASLGDEKPLAGDVQAIKHMQQQFKV